MNASWQEEVREMFRGNLSLLEDSDNCGIARQAGIDPEASLKAGHLVLAREVRIADPKLNTLLEAETHPVRVRQHPEADFQRELIDFAHIHGWKCAHFRRALDFVRGKGRCWRTPIGADGKGFVDLVLVRERVLFVECKAPGGKLGPEQEQWRDWLKAAGQEVYIWYPHNWDTIGKVLE